MGAKMIVRELLCEEYSRLLLERIKNKLNNTTKRTYGFEYEFLPDIKPKEGFLLKIKKCLENIGFSDKFVFSDTSSLMENGKGIAISFEPGGQIEYHSPILFPEEIAKFSEILQEIDEINNEIYRVTRVQYLSIPYLPDRGDIPLCIPNERCFKLEDQFKKSGTRGREMMKGTASIHLHASIQTIGEVPTLFDAIYKLSLTKDFCMGNDRKEIYDNTDNSRCGQHNQFFSTMSPKDFFLDYTNTALDATFLGMDAPFREIEGLTFDDFLFHLTTIFSNVRLNMKGPTIEMRTLDSMPAAAFEKKWKLFVSEVNGM